LLCRAAGPTGAGNDQADARCCIRARANPGTAGASGAGGLAMAAETTATGRPACQARGDGWAGCRLIALANAGPAGAGAPVLCRRSLGCAPSVADMPRLCIMSSRPAVPVIRRQTTPRPSPCGLLLPRVGMQDVSSIQYVTFLARL